jgi:serine/threonine protein kinase/Tol biopolymer transport system component
MTLTPGALLGPYEILTPLGSGGMGEVYRARDRRLDRQVAIKVLPQALTGSSQALERFQREARAASALNHPNICTVHDVGETSDHRQFLVMELLEGETLHDRLLRGALDIAQLLELGTSLVDALAAAHGAGIVHRDIKPANIFLVTRSAGSVIPKILDFGLAKVAADAAAAGATALETRGGSALTDPGSTVGTVAYMSPEQLRGEHLDIRTDLFSLGLVLYEMATGRPTFRGATSAVIAAAILDQEPVPPRQLRADLPARLEDVVLKALEKDREIRYQTASDMRADLRRVKRELASHHGQTPAQMPDAGTVSGVTPALTNTSAAAPLAQSKVESSDAQVVAALVKRHRGGLALAAAAVAIAMLAGGYYVLQQRSAQSTSPAAPGSASFQDVEVTQLTTSGNTAVPAIAPDGKFVAYLQRDDSGTSLWIRQTATASNQQIVLPQPGVELHGATVTPDSSFVDFLRSDSKDPGSLWRVPFLGGSPRKLIDDVAGLPGWSPDGRQMAFVRGQTRLVVADAEGGNERVVVAAPTPRFNALPNLGSLSPAWSPDGRLIALVAFENQGAGFRGLIAFVNQDGSEEQTVEVIGVWGIAWLDNSSLVLSRSGGPGLPVQLWRLSYPHGELSRLTNDLSSYRGVHVTPDRRTLVTARSDTSIGIWVGDGAAGNGVELAPTALGGTPLGFYGMTWAAERLIYPTHSRGRQVLLSFSPDAGTTHEIGLTTMGLAATSDGGTLTYSSPEYSAFGSLWRADADGRNTVQLVPDNSGHPVITPDDRSVLYSSNTRTGIRSLWMVPIDGGTPTEVVKDSLASTGSDVSPDGKSIVFVSAEDPNRPMLVVCDLPACAKRQTQPAAPAVTRLRWTPDGSGIAYDGPESNLWVLPLDGKPRRQLTRFTDSRTIVDFGWSRDGKRLAVARATVKDDIVLFSGLQPGK